MTNLASLVEAIAKQALGGQNNSNQQNSQQNNQQSNDAGGLGGILGSVLGQLNGGNSQQGQSSGGLGSILGSVLGQLNGGNQNQGSGSSFGGGKSALLVAVLPIVLAWIQKQGGLQGALDKLTKSGLGGQAQSWVDPNTAQNQNVEEQHVEQLFDDQDVEQVANQTNESKQNVYAAIATVLPQIIDSLTPQGQSSSQSEANNDIQNILNSLNIR